MVDVENMRKTIHVLKSRVPPVVQMFALAQDWFMVFPALARLVIFTAEHVYSGNPGDRFSAQGRISYNKLAIYNWYEAVWVYMKHGVYNKQYSLARRADNIGYYLVFKTYVGCFSSKSMVSTWFVSYLLVYTWNTPLHYPHAANAGCVLAGVAPVLMKTQSNGNIFRVTGPLCGEFTGHPWIPRTEASDAELWCFLWSAPWINGWVNNREAGDLRCHRVIMTSL